MMDAIVIGGGFYGSVIAIYLAQKRRLKQVLLIEKEDKLLGRASYNNQARAHNGYHYPRSFATAFRSRINFPKFISDWAPAIKKDFTNIYAISKKNSKITALQFERFCHKIGAKIYREDGSLKRLFNPQLIENVFITEEHTFDAIKLAECVKKYLLDHGVQIQLLTRVVGVSNISSENFEVTIKDSFGNFSIVNSRYLFNCTYSNLNQINGNFPRIKTKLKHEITEMALMQMPELLVNTGITVMDGPFFSIMPFPARNLHTLSHVRYTPHYDWNDQYQTDPHSKLAKYDRTSHVELMVRDIRRYLPCINKAKYIDSLFEVKTVLEKNEGDDGRPILFEKHEKFPGCYSILGGKIDNIYDVLEKLDHENFRSSAKI